MNDHTLLKAKGYVTITIAFLPSLFMIRIYELIRISAHCTLQPSAVSSICVGAGVDLLMLLALAAIIVIPCVLISMFHRRIGLVIYTLILLTVTVCYFLLVAYFTYTLYPLNHVVLSNSWSEIITILSVSGARDPLGIIFLFLLMFLPLSLILLLRRMKVSKGLTRVFATILIVSIFILSLVSLPRNKFICDFDYFLSNNLLHYGIFAGNSNFTDCIIVNPSSLPFGNNLNESKKDAHLQEIIKKYQDRNGDFIYLNPNYPFYRLDNTPDVLGPFFDLKPEKPNLVFILVDSLSPYAGKTSASIGSYMPFSDSLIMGNLSWDHIISPFGGRIDFVPALFSSLPSSLNWDRKSSEIPNHFSLIRYLEDNGYYTSLFPAGDTSMPIYKSFLKWEGKPSQKKDSLSKSPRLDIYFTMETDEIFSDFENTIFIITGNGSPLMIVSPLLKESRHFNGVSSYFDITPTLLALLRLPYDLKVKPACHWLGTALNIDNTENMNHETDSLWLQEISQYAVERNALIPASVFYQDLEKRKNIPPSVIINQRSLETNKEYVGMFFSQFEEDFQYLDLDIRFLLKLPPSDTLRLPPLILEVTDSKGNQQVYRRFELVRDFAVEERAMGWNSYQMTERVDLGYMHDAELKRIKIYLWNKIRNLVNLDSSKVTVQGAYY